MQTKKERVRIWPGVEPSHVCKILRQWIIHNKVTSLEQSFDDMRRHRFKLCPRVCMMMKYSGLVRCVIVEAKNAMLGPRTCKQAWRDLCLLQPSLTKTQKLTTLIQQLSRGLRTVCTWFREYAKPGKARAKLLKTLSSAQKAVLDRAIDGIVLGNKESKKVEEDEELDGQKVENSEGIGELDGKVEESQGIGELDGKKVEKSQGIGQLDGKKVEKSQGIEELDGPGGLHCRH